VRFRAGGGFMSSAPVGPMTLIMREVLSQDGLEMASSEDEHAIKALTPQRADKPLGERVCSRRLGRSTGRFLVTRCGRFHRRWIHTWRRDRG
jgi:hypothetical protein